MGDVNQLCEICPSLLHAGHDKFSALRIHKLEPLITPPAIRQIRIAFGNLSHRASAYRWILRGLTTENSILKVRWDLENTETIRAKKSAEKFDRELAASVIG